MEEQEVMLKTIREIKKITSPSREREVKKKRIANMVISKRKINSYGVKEFFESRV